MAIGAPAGLRVPIFRGTPRKTPERPCTNCGDPMPGNFCRMCGQRKIEVRVSLGRMMMEVLDDQFSINSALPRTLVSLLFRPGHLTREYVNGRIARYIPPFRLYLVASVVFFVALSMLPELRDPLANAEITTETNVTEEPRDPATIEARRGELIPAPPRPGAPASAPRGMPARPEVPAGAAAVLGGELRAEAEGGDEAAPAAGQPETAAASEPAAESAAEELQSTPASAATADSAGNTSQPAATAAAADSIARPPQAAAPGGVTAPAGVTEPRADTPADAKADEKAGEAADAQARDVPPPPAVAPVPSPAPARPSGFLKGVNIKTGDAQLDSVANERLEHFRRMEPREAARQLISAYLDHVPQVMFLMLPVFAALLKLLYVRSRRFYVEHFVFALHLHAFAFACYLVMIVTRFPPLTSLLTLWMFIYLFAAMKRVYRQGWFVTATKYAVLGATYAVVVTIAAMLTFVATVLTA